MTLLGDEFGYLEVEPRAPEERRSDREVILLLHGLGGNKQEWTFPSWRGYNYDHEHDPPDRHSDNHITPPLDHLPEFSLSDKKEVRCWSGILRALGHTIIYYNQDGPQARVEGALEQFEERIVPFIRDDVLTGELAGKRVVIIGHSRGGILTRYYLARHSQEASAWIQKVITLHSPHGGTDAPNAEQKLVDSILLLTTASPVLSLVTRLAGWFDPTSGAAQLLPGDPLFDKLSQPSDTPDIEFHTFGGTSVTFSRIYSWHWMPGSYVPNVSDFPDIRYDWTLFPVELAPISPMLDEIPDFMVYAEQRDGQGDGCVTVDRSQLPGVPHESLPVNHAEALFDESLFGRVADVLATPLGDTAAEECTSGYIWNIRTHELHDPSREKSQCQLDEIIDRWPFSLPQDAFDVGYDGCAFCMPEEHRGWVRAPDRA